MNNLSLFQVLVAATDAEDHAMMIAAAKPFFTLLAEENSFAVDFIANADKITEENLAQYQVFVMLHLAPFELTSVQQNALQRFIESGKGWVGIHGAGLTGREFLAPGTPYWQWFEEFLGGVTYSPHPAYQTGRAIVEDRSHPATRNMPASFEIADEWYEFNESPRGKVRVLAVADETTYTQNRPMGDHPIVWVNEQYRRAIYIALGHDPSALTNKDYSVLLRDSILWAGSASSSLL